MSDAYQCDVCGRMCTRTHLVEGAGGIEGYACDDCASYEWEAYGEDADPMLHTEDPAEWEDEERRAYYDKLGEVP